jgi:ABC-type lipoprotein export system ATPase subunit
VFVVSHDARLTPYADRVVHIADGRLGEHERSERPAEPERQEPRADLERQEPRTDLEQLERTAELVGSAVS